MLIHTFCPIDGSDDDVEVYPANWDVSQIDADRFSPRRLPDRIHYRMVRNRKSGCLRADPILDENTIIKLYGASKVTYDDVAAYTGATYLRYLQRVLPHLVDRRGVLEIGCGHGFFLEKLLPLGFAQVRGVEPSLEAVAKTPETVRPGIVTGVLEKDTFAPESFSLVCGFQVLDHLTDPNAVLQHCKRVLVDGGIMFWICHDTGAWVPNLLGESSPMVDIEHVVLYDRRTLRLLFDKNGFEGVEIFGVSNDYPVEYWARLAPMPGWLKRWVLGSLKCTRLGRIRLRANFGNQGIIARKTRA